MTQDPTDETSAAGFRVSAEPVVAARPEQASAPTEEPVTDNDRPTTLGVDLLYAIARDPNSLFLYWELDWSRHFAASGIPPQRVALRVFREDGTDEATIEINPAEGYCFAAVSAPETRYYCELGSYAGSEWKRFIRSGTTATPADEMSEDLEADFATVPFHLSFQRLVEIFRGQRPDLAHSLAALQAQACTLQESISPQDWSQLVETAAATVEAEAGLGLSGVEPAEMAALLRTVNPTTRRKVPSLEMMERWRQLGERFGGSSWGGTSSPAPPA